MEKTEKPTPHRLKKAREEGQTYSSKPFESFVKITFSIFMMYISSDYLLDSFQNYISERKLYHLNGIVYVESTRWLLPFGVLLVCGIITITLLDIILPFIYRDNVISSKRVFQGFQNFKNKINPANLFSKDKLIQLGITFIKIFLFWLVLFFFIKSNLFTTPSYVIVDGKSDILFSIVFKKLIVAMVICGLIIGSLDMLYERHSFIKRLYMTKEEIKEEFKNQEGNPETKAKQKRFRNMILFSDMKKDVKRAKFLLVNPTHIAIPVIYEKENDSPIIGYIGTDKTALKMIQCASLNMVPIVKNIPLARNFYHIYESGDEIQEEHFEVVASIISLITALEGKIDYIDMDS